jgi:hypothetical protein
VAEKEIGTEEEMREADRGEVNDKEDDDDEDEEGEEDDDEEEKEEEDCEPNEEEVGFSTNELFGNDDSGL